MSLNKKRIAVLHGAGYVGNTLLNLLLVHPNISLEVVTSRSGAGKPVYESHPNLFGKTELQFTAPEDAEVLDMDCIFICAEHKQSVYVTMDLLEKGYEGRIVDLSADFRLADPDLYPQWYGYEHPSPELLAKFVYGLTEVNTEAIRNTRFVANPGCFASTINLGLYPLSKHLPQLDVSVTAMTGASGSGAKPQAGTHFPTRSGNMRAYAKPFKHRHQPELLQIIGQNQTIAFVPVSAPWTLGIWAMMHLTLPDGVTEAEVLSWYREEYEGKACIRFWGNQLPQLLPVVNSPFCDIGLQVEGNRLVIVSATDNIMKGAASQAVQNMNLMFGWHDALGLVPNNE